MHTYALHKFVSLAFVLAAIFVSQAVLGTGMAQWQFALLFVVILGYMHFFVGFYYQLKALARRENPSMYYIAFAILVLISVAITYGLLYFFNPLIAFYINIIYFLFHGLLNEQTLIQRQANVRMPLICLLPLMIGALALFNAALFHPSIIFKRDFIYDASFADVFVAMVQQAFSVDIVLNTIVIGFIAAHALAFYVLYKYPYRLFNSVSILLLSSITVVAYFFGPLAYVNIYLFIVGYHFVTWSVYFFAVNRARGPQFLTPYLVVHACVLIPLFITAGLHVKGIEVPLLVDFFRFDSYLLFGMAHITTSFLNEVWLQKIVVRTTALVARRG
mgnify:CR=1